MTALRESAVHGEGRPLSGYTIRDLAQALGVRPQGSRLIELGGVVTIVFLPGGRTPSVHIKDDNGHFKPYLPHNVKVVSMGEEGVALFFRDSRGDKGVIEVKDNGRDVRVVRPEKSAQIPSETPRPYFLP